MFSFALMVFSLLYMITCFFKPDLQDDKLNSIENHLNGKLQRIYCNNFNVHANSKFIPYFTSTLYNKQVLVSGFIIKNFLFASSMPSKQEWVGVTIHALL